MNKIEAAYPGLATRETGWARYSSMIVRRPCPATAPLSSPLFAFSICILRGQTGRAAASCAGRAYPELTLYLPGKGPV